MKIFKTSTLSGKRREMSITEAALDASMPNPYSYNGQLEKLSQENEKLRELVAKMVDCMYGEAHFRYTGAQAVDYILGYGYEVEE